MNKYFLMGSIGIFALLLARQSQASIAESNNVSDIPTGNLRRGERLNNPGNIRHSGIEWVGQASYQPDSEFVAFTSPEYGFRAMARNLLTYQDKYGLRTIRQIINRWAPPVENDTGAYVRSVALATGINSDMAIDLHDEGTLAALMRAMTRIEQGRNIFPNDVLLAGIQATGIA